MKVICLTEEIKSSVLYSDFKRGGVVPHIDSLLDWRNALQELKDKDFKNPCSWYEREIKAVDYLLSLHDL